MALNCFAANPVLASSEINPTAQNTLTNLQNPIFAIHPILGTCAGEHFEAKSIDLEIARKMLFATADPNYIYHETAERDAAILYCKALMAGKDFGLELNPSIGEHYTFGFNKIQIKANFSNGKCTSAFIRDDIEDDIDKEYVGIQNCGRLKHPVLDIAAGEPFSGTALSDWQMRQLNSDFTQTSHKGSERALFSRSEIRAALLFQKQLVGETADQVIARAGKPTCKSRLGRLWGDEVDGADSWIYYLGYSNVPVRLIFENGVCAKACFCSAQQVSNFFSWAIRQLSQYKSSNVPEEIERFYSRDLHPVGLKSAVVVKTFGLPSSIDKDSEGRDVYIYFFNRHGAMRLTFANDICVSTANSMMMGYNQRDFFND